MRRTRVLLFTWLLSWAAALPVIMAFGLGWQYLITHVNPDTLLLFHYVHITFEAALFAPVAYLSWRAVNKFVPHDDNEE